jgi:hypothetical protein
MRRHSIDRLEAVVEDAVASVQPEADHAAVAADADARVAAAEVGGRDAVALPSSFPR